MATKKDHLVSKKDILNTELMKEIISIRIDSLWAMINQIDKIGKLPDKEDEGATSKYDNKGALFVPGNFVVLDSDSRRPTKLEYSSKTPEDFRKHVRECMRHDNATLLYHDGYAKGVNLDNSFHSSIASEMVRDRRAQHKKKERMDPNPPPHVTTDDMVVSYTPAYVTTTSTDGIPYFGSRLKVSSCLAVHLTRPSAYYEKLITRYNPDKDGRKVFWNSIKEARRPIMAEDGKTVLAKPHLIVCHTQRYKPEIMTGITRISGYSPHLGEFSTFTLEEVTNTLMKTVEGRTKPRNNEIIAQYDDKTYVAVMRNYPRTTPGRRLQTNPTIRTTLVSPEKDLGMNLEELTELYREKYKL